MISPRQVRAARALLSWTQGTLATATGVSTSTVGNFESEAMSLRPATLDIMRHVLENSGIEFLDRDGVRFRDNSIKVYKGTDGAEAFFDDMLKTVRSKGGEVIGIFKSGKFLAQSCAMTGNKLGLLEPIQKQAIVKVLLPDQIPTALLTDTFQVRTILKQHIGASSYFVYGNSYSVITAESSDRFVAVAFNDINAVHDYRSHFTALWNMAPPVYQELNPRALRNRA